MADALNKDPFTYHQERSDFLKELQQFHSNRGTPFDKVPKIAGKDVDLYLLYRRVISKGGWRKIIDLKTWETFLHDFHIPRGCSNGGQALKQIYVRFLDVYEKVHFHGEDPNQRDVSDESDHPARKKIILPVFGIPSQYNYEQHKVLENQRQNLGFSTDYVTFSDYEKLEKSLLSGLPNEVDFVFNVCTLLSNESKHVLRLDKSKNLLSLLMAHIGIFEDDNGSLEYVCEYGWQKSSKRDFVGFWFDTIKTNIVESLLYLPRSEHRRSFLGEEVLHMGKEEGIHDFEGQRITQLAVIFRNLSFEEDNMEFMANNDLVFRFLLLCIHCNYGSLRQLALDTLGNLAEKMVLDSAVDEDCNTTMVLELICRCMCAEDKYDVVRGLEILSKLCQLEKNEVVLSDNLEEKIYEDIVRLIGVYDIQIIVHSLEALYQLSELGEITTTKIAAVKHAVNVLIALLTVEAQSYGPNSLVGIKVVEYCPPPQAEDSGASQLNSGTAPPVTQPLPPTHCQPKPNTPVRPPTSAPTSCDVESTTCNWLQATYDLKEAGYLSQLQLYAEYMTFAKKYALPQILPAHSFMNCVKVIFPKVDIITQEKADGGKEICFKGIAKRISPQPFAIHCAVGKPRSIVPSPTFTTTTTTPTTCATVDLTQTTPTLRQRLMAPPRLSSSNQPLSIYPTGENTKSSAISSKPQSESLTQQSPSLKSRQQLAKHLSNKQLAATQSESSPVQVSVNHQMSVQSPNLQSPGALQSNQYYRPLTVLKAQLASPPHPSPSLPQQTGPPNTTSVPVVATTQNLPVMVIQQAFQSDQPIVTQNGPIIPLESGHGDKNMIKTLLAKKLKNNNQTSPVPIYPKGVDTSNPMHLLTFTSQQSNVIQGQLQQNHGFTIQPSPVNQQYQHFTPNQNQIQIFQAADVPRQKFQPQPGIAYASDLSSPIQPPTLNPSRPKSKKKNAKNSSNTNRNISKTARPVSPKNLNVNLPVISTSPHSLSPKSSPKRRNSSSSTGSTRASSPRSPRNCELEVCGEVERAKDIVKVGLEAKIERVENKCLKDLKNIQKNISVEIPSTNENVTSVQTLNTSSTEFCASNSSVLAIVQDQNRTQIQTSNFEQQRLGQSDAAILGQPNFSATSGNLNQVINESQNIELSTDDKSVTNSLPQANTVNSIINKVLTTQIKTGILSQPKVDGSSSVSTYGYPLVQDTESCDSKYSDIQSDTGDSLSEVPSMIRGTVLPNIDQIEDNSNSNSNLEACLIEAAQSYEKFQTQESVDGSEQVKEFPVVASDVNKQESENLISVNESQAEGPKEECPLLTKCNVESSSTELENTTNELDAVKCENVEEQINCDQSEDKQSLVTTETNSSEQTEKIESDTCTQERVKDCEQEKTSQSIPEQSVKVETNGIETESSNLEQSESNLLDHKFEQTENKLEDSEGVEIQEDCQKQNENSIDSEQSAEPTVICNESNDHIQDNNNACSQEVLMNGQMSDIPEPEIIPSPVDNSHQGMNGLSDNSNDGEVVNGEKINDDMSVKSKESDGQFLKMINKLNGIIKHAESNELQEGGNSDVEMVEEEESQEEQNVIVDADSLQMVLQASEGEQFIIDSQGNLEKLNNGNMSDTEEAEMAVTNGDIAMETAESVSEDMAGLVSTDSGCMELVGDPEENMEEDESDDVIIENEMCLQPAPSVPICKVPSVDEVSSTDSSNMEAALIEAAQNCEKAEQMGAGTSIDEDEEEKSSVEINDTVTAGSEQKTVEISPSDESAIVDYGESITNTVSESVNLPSEIQNVQSENSMSETVLDNDDDDLELNSENFDGTDILSQSMKSASILGPDDMYVTSPALPTEDQIITTVANNKQVSEVCPSRHIPTPEAARDSELSCDSIASSVTDSSIDKHSVTLSLHNTIPTIQTGLPAFIPTTNIIFVQTSANKTFSTNQVISPGSSQLSPRSRSTEKKAKKRVRNKSGSSDSRSSTTSSNLGPELMCEWAGCKKCFENAKNVFFHVVHFHLGHSPEGYCLWEGCEKLQRKRWSLVTHIQDHHCSEIALKAAALKRHQAAQPGSTAQPHTTVPALVYPPDAAWQAIRRFTPKPPYPEFQEAREGPVTKHIRLTAALILRNLARYSALGRSLIKRHEHQINFTAMSNLESSNALANCLFEVLHDH